MSAELTYIWAIYYLAGPALALVIIASVMYIFKPRNP